MSWMVWAALAGALWLYRQRLVRIDDADRPLVVIDGRPVRGVLLGPRPVGRRGP